MRMSCVCYLTGRGRSHQSENINELWEDSMNFFIGT